MLIPLNNKFSNLYRDNLQHGRFIDCEEAICSTKVKSIEPEYIKFQGDRSHIAQYTIYDRLP